jgi:hypothetical protein
MVSWGGLNRLQLGIFTVKQVLKPCPAVTRGSGQALNYLTLSHGGPYNQLQTDLDHRPTYFEEPFRFRRSWAAGSTGRAPAE